MFKCKDCTMRYPGCHDHCESYQNTKAEREGNKALYKEDEELRKYVLSNCFKRRNEMSMQKKRHSGYKRLKGLN